MAQQFIPQSNGVADQDRAALYLNTLGSDKNKNNPLQQMIMLNMLGKMNPQLLLGNGLAQVLAMLFGRWKDNYDLKNEWKSKLKNDDPKEFEKSLSKLKTDNPNGYEKIQPHLQRWGYQSTPTAEPTSPENLENPPGNVTPAQVDNTKRIEDLAKLILSQQTGIPPYENLPLAPGGRPFSM